ncbi:hypothetical protein [Vitiosangium sp. GDMCC 1.1324]|uniref:hypothetical protein n=1 Tax=Vitiosangium sp. (strain GDMCC 1.1324) TaxID=2138576 RepID=UPI000D381B71|nr:hypothetical protein [Vitiosangium sp. GDMCC 1.1324]PTL82284.1 hypothetical protein DAT35_21085 [Vitiosangium sp. GDMCC 1.1324]
MTDVYTQLVRALASRRTRSTTVALLVAGALVIHAAPPEYLPTAVVGGSLGFALVFTWLFFHSGISRLPPRHRGPLLLGVLVMLSLLLLAQVYAVLALAGEVLQTQALQSRSARWSTGGAQPEEAVFTGRASSGSH